MRIRFKVAANTLAQLVGRGVSAIISFIITILVARHFGVEAYGELTKILTFVVFFDLAVDFGLNAITVKELGESNNSSQILRTLFSTRILLGILLVWLAVMATVFLPFSPETGEGFSRLVKLGIILFAPTILLQAVVRSTNAYFQFRLRYDKATIAVVLGSITSLLLISGTLHFKLPSILFIVAAFLLAAGVHMGVAFLLFKRLLPTPLGFSFNIPRIIALLKKSLPLGLTLVLNIAFFRLDTFLLAIFRPTTEVGLYGLAYKFFEFPLALPTFFMNAVYPVLSNLQPRTLNADETKFRAIIKKSAIFLLLSSIVLTATLWFTAPYIVLIKDDFVGSIILFRLLILWLPLFFFTSLLMWVLVAKGNNWRLAGIYAAGLLVNTVLNLFLIPSHGASAAALTTGATEAFILLLLLFNLRTN